MKSGYVWYTQPIFRWKVKAKLILTNHPRLVVIDGEKNKKLDEMQWNCTSIEGGRTSRVSLTSEGGVPVVMLEVTSEAPECFKVVQLDGKKPSQRKYQLIDGNAEDWMDAIHSSPLNIHPSKGMNRESL